MARLRGKPGRRPLHAAEPDREGEPNKVFENLIILGSAVGEEYFSAPGDVRAFNVITGKLARQFHTMPRPGEPGYETWPKEPCRYAGGGNTWGELSVDSARGIVYFPLGSPTFDFYGDDRAADPNQKGPSGLVAYALKQ